jgi:hypothetical protein
VLCPFEPGRFADYKMTQMPGTSRDVGRTWG